MFDGLKASRTQWPKRVFDFGLGYIVEIVPVPIDDHRKISMTQAFNSRSVLARWKIELENNLPTVTYLGCYCVDDSIRLKPVAVE